jgi:oligoendopeptidase F
VYARAEAGEALTAAVLNDCKGAILQRFWGDTVRIDDGARMTWMRQPHYYMGLYPYTYSVGLVASTAMALRVQQEGAPAVARWIDALKAGGTRRPLQLLQGAGIDLSTPQPIHDAVAHAGRLIDGWERLFEGGVAAQPPGPFRIDSAPCTRTDAPPPCASGSPRCPR